MPRILLADELTAIGKATDRVAVPEVAPTAYAKVRRAPRYYFGGAVELTEFDSGQMIVALVRALSSYGCFIRTEKSFPIGTRVKLKFAHLGACFSEVGRVVNHVAHKENPGIGVEFVGIDPTDRERLESCLAQLAARKEMLPSLNPARGSIWRLVCWDS
jgi:hypothetical protein